MTQIIGGHNLGLLFGSYTILNRNDQTSRGSIGHGVQSFANVSNGNLILQERDFSLPNAGADFDLIRTYNSRDDTGPPPSRWTFSFNVTLQRHDDQLLATPSAPGPQPNPPGPPPASTKVTDYTVFYGDGTEVDFVWNAAKKMWVSTDGAGAYETLVTIPPTTGPGPNPSPTPDGVPVYVVTRADQSVYSFDEDFKLLSIKDTNGVTTTFTYQGNNVVTIKDDNAHTLTLTYQGDKLIKVSDETLATLVTYVWQGDKLISVTDRDGHTTTYHYTADGLIDSITLPTKQAGDATTYAARTVSFQYTKVHWDDHPYWSTPFDTGDAWVLSQITDADGGVTTFDYNFQFQDKFNAVNDRDLAFKPNGGPDFQGGTTRVVDALGNARAYSNDAQYVAWRQANGFYTLSNGQYVSNYDPKKDAAKLAAQLADAGKIRAAQSVTYTYDPNGQLTKVKNELGFETNYTYDFNGNLTSITDNNGWGVLNLDTAYYVALRTRLGIVYASGANAGMGKAVADLTASDKTALAKAFTSTFTYDANGNMLTSTDNAGNTTTYTYTAFNQVASMTTAKGFTTNFAYDAHQNLIQRTDGLGNIVAYAYDAKGNLTQKTVYLDKTDLVTTSKQEVTTYAYDAFGNNTGTTTTVGGGSLPITASKAYDHFGNLISSTDGRGNQTLFAYDADNRLLSMTDPEGHTTSYAYDAVGNQISVKDANNHTITRVYDPDNLLLTTIDSSSDASKTRTTSLLYDILGDNTRTTDAAGRITTYSFDAHRQVIDIADLHVKASDGVSYTDYHQTFAYDGEAHTITRVDRNGNTTQYQFTVNGQTQRITDAVGNVTEYSYDADLQQSQIIIGAQLTGPDLIKRRILTFTYDSDDQMVTESDGLGSVRGYSYDAVGNVTGVTDGNSQTTNFEYDLNNRMIREIRPGSDGVHARYAVTHQYDANGNEVSTTDEDFQTTTFNYDKDNRVVLVTDGAGFQTAYAWDSRDNRTSISVGVTAHMDANSHVVIDSLNGARTTSYAYDEFNQLISQSDGFGIAETYAYDKIGNQTSVTNRLLRTTSTQYDELNRAISVTEAQGTAAQRVTNYRYDGNGNIVESNSLDRETKTVYDRMNRITQTTDALGTVTQYVLDSFGNVKTRIDGFNLGAAAWRETDFDYDTRGRMTKQTDALSHVTTYAYDGEDHLITRISAVGLPEQRTEHFEYNADGQLSAQVDGAGNRTEFTYDGVGNRKRIDVLTAGAGSPVLRSNSYEYDGDNRVTAEIDGNGVRTEYRYDASGNRIETIQAKGVAGQERHTLMFYDADNRLTSVVDPIGWARAYSNVQEFRDWRTAHSYLADATFLTPVQVTAILDTQRTSYAYDNDGNQTTITEADGTVTQNTFDALDRLVTNTVGVGGPHGGIRTTNTYDSFDNVLTSTKSFADSTDARTTTYTYDKLDHQLSVTDGEGFKTLFEYDAFGNQTRIERGVYTGADTAKQQAQHIYDTHLTYDAMDRLLTTTDGRGNRVSNAYDALGDRTSQISGQTTSNADAAHASTLTFTYDHAGRMIERDDPTGGVVQITYDAAGNQTTVRTLQSGTVASGVWTTRTNVYDGNGRVVASTDSFGTRTEYNFDAVGNLTSIVNAAGTPLARTFASEYDLNNNKTATLDAYSHRTTFAYDAVGNMVKRTDALGGVSRVYYDAFGNVIATLDALNYLTSFTRDSAGNTTQTRVYMTAIAGPVADGGTPPAPVADAVHDRVTSSVFDRANRLTQQTAPDGSYRTYAYDSTDKLLTQTQYAVPNNTRTANTAPRVLQWRYDDSGRLSMFTNADGTVETYGYDAANNKTSQTSHNPNLLAGGRVDPDRTTTFAYDLDNRLTTQVFDPDSGGHTGLKLTQSLGYDLEGNVVSKTDADNHISTTRYDQENRITRVTDPLGHYVTLGYDALGNKTSVSDAIGNTTTLVYDSNNRLIQEIHPLVSVDTWVLGVFTTETIAPTTTTTYDAAGNVVQVTDARGFTTTSWYDAAGNLVATRNGDGAVRTFTYDALGELLTVTQDMQFHAEAVDLTTAPQILGANPHVATNTYDLGGRVVQTMFSQITVTTLADTTVANPTSSTSTVTPSEYNYYDGWGNLVESVDRDGNHSYAWYDALGRQVATLDASRYLTESDYDDQGNVVQQRKFKTQVAAWNGVGQRAGTRPAAPDASPVKVDRVYDAANRLIEEWSPAVHATVGGVTGEYRVVTAYTYDAAGNMTSKALDYATISSGGTRTATALSAQRVEYDYYDAANRRSAVVGANRVLNTFSYDANGNLTSQKRFWYTIPGAFDLSTATLATVTAQVSGHENSSRDEETLFDYDSNNRLIRRTDRMDLSTTSDDLVNLSSYDEDGNLTYRRDPDGYETKSRFDAAGHIIETVAPNGSHSFIEYDTGGLKVKAWTGGAAGSFAHAATITGAAVGNGANGALVITWNETAANTLTWVAWGTTSRPDSAVPSTAPGVGTVAYPNATSASNTGNGLTAQLYPSTGGLVYFRVVSRDAAGNLAWTEEESVYVPPRIQSLNISKPDADYRLTLTFDTAVTSADLQTSSSGTPTDYAVSHNAGMTQFTFTFSGSNIDKFHVTWMANGTTYTTSDVAFLAAAGLHTDGGNGWVNWPLPSDGTTAVGNGQYTFLNGQLVADKTYLGSLNGTAYSAVRSTRTNGTQLNFQPLTATSTTDEYDVLYGNLAASTHSASISWTQIQHATVSNVQHTTGPDNTTWDVTWANQTLYTNISATFLAAEDSNISGGVHFDYRSTTMGVGGFTTGATDSTGSSHSYSVALALTPGSSYDIKIWYTDTSGKEVIVEFRRITVPADATVPSVQHLSLAGNFTPTAPSDVTVNLGTTQNYTGDRSLQVLAQETGGSIHRGSTTALTVTAGTYVGPVNPGTSSVPLDRTTTTGSTGASRSSDGFVDKTYFTQIEYNALGAKVASNEDSGLWRRYGVDANGNIVETDLYGTQDAENSNLTPIKSFEAYDARNLEVASWDASVIGGNRGVTRTTYDYARQAVSVLDPGNTSNSQARTFTYDDVGDMTGSTDALGNATSTVYNVFGQWVSQTDGNSHTRRRTYDATGQLTDESTDSVTDHLLYTYDVFGRRVTQSRGVAGDETTVTMDYDQRDRVTTVYDAANGSGHAVHYIYDGRDNRIWTEDAMGRWFGAAFDGMGQQTHKYSFQTFWEDSSGVTHTGTAPTTYDDVKAAVAGTNATFAATLRDEVSTYDLFGNKTSVTDPAGHHQFYSYGAFGRLTSVSGDPSSSDPTLNAVLAYGGISTTALVTNYTYDRFGNRVTETSNYGKNIAYSYDDDGRITSIDDTGLATANAAAHTKTTYTYDLAGRRATEELQKGSPLADVHNTTYTYNANGWTTSWSDSTTGIGETFTYDNVGNVATVTGKTSSNASYLTHSYTYDTANRVLTTSSDTYTYDSRGRRATWVNGGNTVTYTYDDADRVTIAAETGGTTSTLKWTYDRDGNVTSVRDSDSLTLTIDGNGVVTGISGRDTNRNYTWYKYDANNAGFFSQSSNFSKHNDGYTQTTTQMDQSQRVLATIVVDGSDPGSLNSYTYTHAYNADGTEANVNAGGSGNVSGTSVSSYDVDRQLTHVDLGKGDNNDHNETKNFTYDNTGHIISATHDDGQSGHTGVTTNYLYANDFAAGEYGSASSPTLDTGNYSVLQNVPGAYGSDGPNFPSTGVNDHIVQAGETLQSIASQVYGHPELWYVIADANGLTGSEQLTPGTRLVIPNSVQYAGDNVQTHTIYKEGDIIGSKLPNLTSPPPPPQDKCAVITAIILIVVVAIVAVVVTVVTVGAAAPAAAAALGVTATSVAGILIGVAVGAVIGAAVAFTASVITQGILIGFNLQQGFDWNAVAADTVAGAFSGAAVGLGSIIRVAETATTLVRVANVVGQTALQVGGEISRQVIISGHVDDWTGVALAGVGGALGAYGAQAERDRKVYEETQKIIALQKEFAAALKTSEELAVPLSKVRADAAEEAATKAAAAAKTNTAKVVRVIKTVIAPIRTPLIAIGDVLGGNTGRISKLEQATIRLRASIAVTAREAAQFAGKSAELPGEFAIVKETLAKFGAIGAGLAYNFQPGNAGTRQSAYSFGAGGGFGTVTGIRNVSSAIYRSVQNTQAVADADNKRRQAADAAARALASPDIGKSAFTDRNAATDFADLHQRRHGWVVTSWTDAASSSASQIVSSFSIDRFASLRTVLDFDRLLAGETSHFTRGAISSLAAGTVGHVATNPIPLPITLLDNQAPNARG